MKLASRGSSLITELTKEDLNIVVRVLNGEPVFTAQWRDYLPPGLRERDFAALRLELQELVTAWKRSGPNLTKMLDANKDLSKKVEKGKTLLVTSDSGRAQLMWIPDPAPLPERTVLDHAAVLFVNLVLNPYWESLGGPCRRCDKYYIKKTVRQESYCSRRCGAAITALEATRSRRQAQLEKKLEMAQGAIKEWQKQRPAVDWKSWVCLQTELTLTFLTRAVNNGAIHPPK